MHMHHSGERWTGIEGGAAGRKFEAISGHRMMFRAGITPNVRQCKQFSLPVGQSMSYHIDYGWVMKRNRSSTMMLIRPMPHRRRFAARRGVAILRAWRMRFSKPDEVRLTQIEFNLGQLKRGA